MGEGFVDVFCVEGGEVEAGRDGGCDGGRVGGVIDGGITGAGGEFVGEVRFEVVEGAGGEGGEGGDHVGEGADVGGGGEAEGLACAAAPLAGHILDCVGVGVIWRPEKEVNMARSS